MADDPTAGKCPKCGNEELPRDPQLACRVYVCGTRRIMVTDNGRAVDNVVQSDACQLATMTAERDHFRRRYVELYSTVWGEQYADFDDSDANHAEAMEEIERCNRALLEVKDLTAERDRLLAMAELLEGQTEIRLPTGNVVERCITFGGQVYWHMLHNGLMNRYPTARAAISAAMGWEERSGT